MYFLYQAIDCGDPTGLLGLNQEFYAGNAPSKTKFKAVVNVICASNLDWSDGTKIKEIKCNENGVWSSIQDSCCRRLICLMIIYIVRRNIYYISLYNDKRIFIINYIYSSLLSNSIGNCCSTSLRFYNIDACMHYNSFTPSYSSNDQN